MNRWTGRASVVLGLAALAAAGWWLRSGSGAAPPADSRPPYVLPVSLAEVVREDLQPSTRLTGSVRAPSRARLAFRVEGLLLELAVREAETFEAGQLLARLSSAGEELELAGVRSQETLAQRSLEKLEAGARQEEKDRLQARLEAAEAQERLAGIEVERLEKLPSDRFVSQVELDRLRAAHEAAAAAARASERELAQSLAGTREEDLAIARAELEVVRARLAQAQENLEKTKLHALSAGVVQRRMAAPGDWLDKGQGVLEIVDLGELEIDVEIPGRVAPLLGESAPVRVLVDELPDFALDTRLTARVPAADERSRNFRGIVRLDGSAAGVELLRPGMFVRLEVSLASHEGVLVVPSDAVRETDRGPILVRASRVSGGEANGSASAGDAQAMIAEWVPVRVLGARDGRTAVEALSVELAAGDPVVVLGVDLAFPGAPLFVRQTSAGTEGPAAAVQQAGSH
jgi:RND family efflux transporter MFP subunit